MIERNIKVTRLSDLETGADALIVKVLGHGAFRKRITEMGFVKGKKVKVIKNAPLQDPVEYKIMDYNVTLRRSEAQLVEVVAIDAGYIIEDSKYEGTLFEDLLNTSAVEKSSTINIALVGNPNSGKTTLYNFASGSHERVGNYSGVTVDAREAEIKKYGYTFKIVDLPGTYSITEFTPEELFVRNHISENHPDIVVNVVDASNLERNLYLTTQLIDMNIKVVMALNMYDELEKSGARFDYSGFGKLIGIPVIPTVASKGKGVDHLLKKVIEVYEDNDPTARHIHINYGKNIESAICGIQFLLKDNKEIADRYSTRYLAIKLLENDKTTNNLLSDCKNISEIRQKCETEMLRLEKEYKEKSDSIITDAKYGFIAGAVGETYRPGFEDSRKLTAQIDNILTHKLLGFPFFVFFLWLMFQITFTVGSIPMDLIDSGVSALGSFVSDIMPQGPLRDLLVDGIISGVGGVIVFLPNILILFFFISFMEDTGYMARASFIMDRLMHKIGLHGKSFIPIIMGFGCNVPAIMATRTLENKKDRILTMLIIPFMSCSARLPVYVLLISAFFPHNQGLVLVSIYLVGIVLAIFSALLVKKFMFKEKDVPFVMELPPYRIPTLKNTSRHMWHKGAQYIRKMGSIILIASIIIWALGYFPMNIEYSKNYKELLTAARNDSNVTDSMRLVNVAHIEAAMKSEKQEKSYIGILGHSIEPVIEPLGFDWKIGVSIITGLAAKEIVVSTMGVLYQSGEGETNVLQKRLQEQTYQSGDKKGKKVFSPLVALSFMLFVLIYFPCVAATAAIKKESNIKYALFVTAYTTVLAWLVAFITFQVGSLFI